MLNEENVIDFMIGGILFSIMAYFFLQILLSVYKAAKSVNDEATKSVNKKEQIARESLARSSNAMKRGHRR